jgi:hypothetical protein
MKENKEDSIYKKLVCSEKNFEFELLIKLEKLKGKKN